MKKYISFLLTILICFQFTFTYSWAVETNHTQMAVNQVSTSNSKLIKYLAVFIKFSDNTSTNHIDDLECVANAQKIFNSEDGFEMNTVNGVIRVPSFKKYYEMQSYGKLSITTEIFPRVNGKVVSYTDLHPIGYYLKYNENNPIGYKNAQESLQRETELVNNAVKFVAKQVELAGIKASEIDVENDQIVDAISFFVEGQKDLPSSIAWNDLLWSHKLDNTGITETILGKRVVPYNLIYVSDYTESAGAFSLNRGTYGTILHEFGHTLGYMDLYRHDTSQPVGFYDIMGNTIGSNPQNLLTYFITDYRAQTNWHQPLPVISQTTSSITLTKPEFKDDNEKRAIKIQQYAGSEEYFIVEYHEKQNTYDSYCADSSGIIIYRVNDKNKYHGNTSGGSQEGNDHIFIFRPNETILGAGQGDLRQATLNKNRATLGKEIGKESNTFDNKTIYYSDGSNSGIVIEVTEQTDKSITFNVTFPKVQGEGSKDNPYLIYDVDTFLYLMKTETKNRYYKLMNDLDFSSIKDYPKIDFKGNLNGNNKTLKNISSVGTGVFNSVGDYNFSSSIENLNVENIKVSPETGNHIGGFTNSVENTTLKNIHLKSGSVNNVKSSYNELSSTGGFVGSIYNDAIIDNCSSSLTVSSEKNVGGFVGINMNGTIKNSYANGKVSGESNVGAFIGLQCITDAKYKVPENVYFDEAKAKTTKAVGGYASSLHDIQVLSEKDLGKGIVGILTPEEVNINKVGVIDYKITTNPNTNLLFTIYSSDKTIVTYENYKVQGLKNGTAKIYVDLKVGTQVMKMESKVNVTNIIDTTDVAITSIVLDKNSITLNENEVAKLSVTLNPVNHTMSKEVKWTSSNSKVASVDGNGKITANAEGSATITATTVNKKSASCVVTVKKKSELPTTPPPSPTTVVEQEVLKHFGLTKQDGYVVGFQLGSSVASVKQLLSSYPNVTLSNFQDASGREISTGTISTNMRFTLTFNQKEYHYIVVIKGDVNGDGSIYATDYVKIKNHIMGKTKLEGAYLKAADINNDNNIYATDYVRIKNYIMGKGNIEQSNNG